MILEPDVTTLTEPTVDPGQLVILDSTQFDSVLQSLHLLTNRFEFMLLLNILLVAVILFQIVRSK